MGIGIFYVIAFIPALIGAGLILGNKRIVWWEWLAGVGAGLLCSAAMHLIAVKGMTAGIETLSGEVKTVTFHPFWMQLHHYTTISRVGKSTVVHHHTIVIPHPEYRTAEDTLGNDHTISPQFFEQIKVRLGATVDTRYAGHYEFLSGDNNIYVTRNTTGYIQPVTKTHSWENRVKAAPSVFSFPKIPPGKKVYPWPETHDAFRSTRLIGLTGDIDQIEFDRMNSRLGPTRKVNVILIGFGPTDISIAEWQRAAWIGGKKNDLVICFGGSPSTPTWAKVFGWTEGDTCKYELQDVVMRSGVSTATLPKIEAVIMRSFKAKDWSKFDYLTIEPRPWHYITLIIVMAISQVVFWLWACRNEYNK